MRKLVCFLIILVCSTCQRVQKMDECEKTWNEIQVSFAKRAKTPELVVVGSGGGIDEDKISELSFTFNYKKIMTLDVARKLIVTEALDLIDMIQENPQFTKCFDSKNLLNSHIDIAILAQNPNDRATDFISVVSTHGGMVYYRKIGPLENPYPSIKVHRETFEEAVAIIKEEI